MTPQKESLDVSTRSGFQSSSPWFQGSVAIVNTAGLISIKELWGNVQVYEAHFSSPVVSIPRWIVRTLARVNKFSERPSESGAGVSCDPKAIVHLMGILNDLFPIPLEITPPAVTLNSSGDIEIAWRNDEWHIDIEFSATDGDSVYIKDVSQDKSYYGTIDANREVLIAAVKSMSVNASNTYR